MGGAPCGWGQQKQSAEVCGAFESRLVCAPLLGQSELLHFSNRALVLACHAAGNCPISPLALPRRLTDGALVGSALPSINAANSGLAGKVSGAAAALAEPFPGEAGSAADARQQSTCSPMRKRIVNLTVAADALPPAGRSRLQPLPRSGAASPELTAGAAAGSPGLPARSLQVLSSMHSLVSSNPELPIGLRSSLRASAPTLAPGPAAPAEGK